MALEYKSYKRPYSEFENKFDIIMTSKQAEEGGGGGGGEGRGGAVFAGMMMDSCALSAPPPQAFERCANVMEMKSAPRVMKMMAKRGAALFADSDEC